ncbi:MAG: class-II fumarase/aspartase family protein [Acidimicrobiales bacterium]
MGIFDLLLDVFGDPETARILSTASLIESWLHAERALAAAEAEVGLIKESDVESIEKGATLDAVDEPLLWESTRVVGYPILPLVRMVAGRLPEGPNGRVHYGATTQDIMDTGLVLQLRRALGRLDELLAELGDAIAALVEEHRDTPVAARTHSQQAVPTTFGATLATFLAELARHRRRLDEVAQRVGVVSLYGAGGTSAAFGPQSEKVRRAFARRLGLGVADVPWHAARDCFAELGSLCALVSATAGRFSTNIINLARTEIAEVTEGSGYHYGASSTMPQKHNPIRSEVALGMSIVASGLVASLGRVMVVPHERAAGEWQAEWHIIPHLVALATGALWNCCGAASHLRVHPEAMRRNLGADGGRILAEGYMIGLAGVMGREVAHDLVYQAARQEGDLGDALRRIVPDEQVGLLEDVARHTTYDSYVGEARRVCDRSLAAWRSQKRSQVDPEERTAEP